MRSPRNVTMQPICIPSRSLKVAIDRFASDEEVHDLARALEDQVDAEVPHDALDGDGRLTPRPTQTYPLNDAVRAFTLMAGAQHIGKIVLTL